MIIGRMYKLDKVLELKNYKCSLYLLVDDGESGYEISFGRQRRIRVSSECYVVTLEDGKYELDKVIFNGCLCNYLDVLKERNISYEIPKTLPESISRMYSRFECAVGYTYWSKNIRGFFGKNGYAITDIGYIGDDRYESYEINLCNQGSFRIGKHIISGMYGHEIPNDPFIVKLLEAEVSVDEGEPLVTLLKEAGVSRKYLEDIHFEIADDE